MIEKIKGWKFKGTGGKLDNHLTESFRKLAQVELGELDTATSFMYLYNRFGKPNLDSRDEYKILYEYRFLYKDLFVTIHASYHSHVVFGLLVRSSVIHPLWQEHTENLINIGKRHFEQGVIFYPSLFYNGLPAKYKEFNRENNKAVKRSWNEYWKTKTKEGLKEFNELRELVEKSEEPIVKHKSLSEIWDKYKEPFFANLVEKFTAALSKDEYRQFVTVHGSTGHI